MPTLKYIGGGAATIQGYGQTDVTTDIPGEVDFLLKSGLYEEVKPPEPPAALKVKNHKTKPEPDATPDPVTTEDTTHA